VINGFYFCRMSFANRYIETAEKIIISYDGKLPLQHHLKQFFAADKKYGSKDRKAIAHACYCYFRLGQLKAETINEKIRLGIFLCTDQPGNWKDIFEAEWIDNWSNDPDAKLRFTITESSLQEIFPLQDELSLQLSKEAFTLSHLVQPDLYLRIRPGRKDKIISALTKAEIPFSDCGVTCVALPNGSKIDELIQLNQDAVVQDLSSQRIAEFFQLIEQKQQIKIWDCCAASGGKSILAVDHFTNVELTVSDVRSSIIQNLKKRFAEAGIKNYRSFVTDLTVNRQPSTVNYDLIICDAPCSGSGTWSRTPEQLSFFKKEKINYYSELQRKIVSAIIPAVIASGHLLYITCSVFKQENEEMVEYILANSNLQLVKMDYLVGYDKKADTMFAALFTASTP